MKNTKFKSGDVVAWTWQGWRAVGIISEYGFPEVSIAVDYKQDSNVCKGGLWYADEIHCDEGTVVEPARASECKKLIKAFYEHIMFLEREEAKRWDCFYTSSKWSRLWKAIKNLF